jgi:transaldolase
MKLFLDTANLEDIRAWAYLIDGVTTNPSHLAHENKDPKKQVLEICSLLPDKDISVEVTLTEPKAVADQARAIAKLAPNIVVKIPCYQPYYPIIAQLVREGIKINVTLVFTLVQSLFMCKLGVKYISPFIGRWDDIDVEGVDILFELRSMVDQYSFSTQILAASIRSIRHLHEAILAGADVATVPTAVLEKSSQHILTKEGMEKFNADWNKLGHTKFP